MDATRLRQIPLFSSLSERELRRVAKYVGEEEVAAGDALVEQGTFSWAFFVILEGEAEVVRDGRHLAELGAGDFLGEAGVMQRAPRNASVVARSPLSVAYMTARGLRSMAKKLPGLAERLDDAIAERARVLAG